MLAMDNSAIISSTALQVLYTGIVDSLVEARHVKHSKKISKQPRKHRQVSGPLMRLLATSSNGITRQSRALLRRISLVIGRRARSSCEKEKFSLYVSVIQRHTFRPKRANVIFSF